jgi:hypothetical protein
VSEKAVGVCESVTVWVSVGVRLCLHVLCTCAVCGCMSWSHLLLCSRPWLAAFGLPNPTKTLESTWRTHPTLHPSPPTFITAHSQGLSELRIGPSLKSHIQSPFLSGNKLFTLAHSLSSPHQWETHTLCSPSNMPLFHFSQLHPPGKVTSLLGLTSWLALAVSS